MIHADAVIAGRDLAASASARLGDSTNYIGTPLTVTSSDPTKVLLSGGAEDAGQPQLTISNGTNATNGTKGDYARRDFRVYCLTGSGTFPLVLSAPGYASRSINVRCVPSALYLAKTDIAVQGNGETPPRGIGAIGVVTAAFDPHTMQFLHTHSLPAGLHPPTLYTANPPPRFLT